MLWDLLGETSDGTRLGIHHLPISQRCTEKVLHLWRLNILMYGWSSILGQTANIWDCFTRIFGFLIGVWVCFPCTMCFCVDPSSLISSTVRFRHRNFVLRWHHSTASIASCSNPDFGVSKVLCRCLDVAFKSKDAHGLFWKPLGWTYHFSLVFSFFFFRRKLHFRWHLPNKFVE